MYDVSASNSIHTIKNFTSGKSQEETTTGFLWTCWTGKLHQFIITEPGLPQDVDIRIRTTRVGQVVLGGYTTAVDERNHLHHHRHNYRSRQNLLAGPDRSIAFLVGRLLDPLGLCLSHTDMRHCHGHGVGGNKLEQRGPHYPEPR